MSQSLTVKEAITTRRSIKKFNGQAVDRADLMEILEDAVWAPNHGNRQPWRVVAACGPELAQLHTLLRDLAIPKWQELSEEALAAQMQKFTLPGGYAFIIVPEDARQKESLEAYAAASSFLQNVQLFAWATGIGSCWKTPGFLDNPKFRQALNVQPGERVISMLQVGYFDEVPAAKERKSIEQFVSIFGE